MKRFSSRLVFFNYEVSCKKVVFVTILHFDTAIEVANVTARRSASVGICHLAGYRHFPSRPGDLPLQQIWLLV